MPEGTPFNKIRRTRAFSVKVVLHGDHINAAEPFAHTLADEEKPTFAHRYDNEHFIAGQGTVRQRDGCGREVRRTGQWLRLLYREMPHSFKVTRTACKCRAL